MDAWQPSPGFADFGTREMNGMERKRESGKENLAAVVLLVGRQAGRQEERQGFDLESWARERGATSLGCLCLVWVVRGLRRARLFLELVESFWIWLVLLNFFSRAVLFRKWLAHKFGICL